MIDGERRGMMAAHEQFAPVLSELGIGATKITMPSDQALGEMAATAWTEFQSRGYAHIEPRESFLHGYATAVRQMLHVAGCSIEKKGQ